MLSHRTAPDVKCGLQESGQAYTGMRPLKEGAEPTATAQPAAPAQRKYTVEAGDTLRSIAAKFDVSVQAIIDANKLTPQEADSLRVGQELIIP